MSEPFTDEEAIRWARSFAKAYDGTLGEPSATGAKTRRLADLAERARTLLDCGQDLCATAPGCMRHWAERNREVVAKAETQAAEITRLRDALHLDQSGLAAALGKVVDEIGGRMWVEDSRGPYEWDDDRYKAEAGEALRTARDIARNALRASGTLSLKALLPAPPGGER